MLKVDRHFKLDPLWHELIVAVTIGAAALAAAAAGPLTEWLGRKPVLILASFIFTVGAVVMGVAPDKYILLLGRVIVGLGIGLAAMAVPMYIAESAPAHLRGKLVVMNNMFITGGQFVATILDGAFSSLSDRIGWRYTYMYIFIVNYRQLKCITFKSRSCLMYTYMYMYFIRVNSEDIYMCTCVNVTNCMCSVSVYNYNYSYHSLNWFYTYTVHVH